MLLCGAHYPAPETPRGAEQVASESRGALQTEGLCPLMGTLMPARPAPGARHIFGAC